MQIKDGSGAQADLCAVLLLVQQGHRQPGIHRQAEVMVAVRADPEPALQLAVEDHLLALRALLPEIVRNRPRAGADPFTELGADDVGEPAHAVAARRAWRTPCASWLT